MEAEHGSIDPRLEQIDTAVEGRDAIALDAELKSLAQGLSEHMIHEEQSALPLLERRTGTAGWEAFSKEIRDQQGGLKGAAEYLPLGTRRCHQRDQVPGPQTPPGAGPAPLPPIHAFEVFCDRASGDCQTVPV